jgi:hypothetical protein
MYESITIFNWFTENGKNSVLFIVFHWCRGIDDISFKFIVLCVRELKVENENNNI